MTSQPNPRKTVFCQKVDPYAPWIGRPAYSEEILKVLEFDLSKPENGWRTIGYTWQYSNRNNTLKSSGIYQTVEAAIAAYYEWRNG